MLFDEITGHKRIIEHLKNTVATQKVSHAQLFSGPEGAGILSVAIAYAQYVLCSQNKNKEACDIKVKDLNHPDLHFVYPVGTTPEFKSKPISKNFISQWREFLNDGKFGTIQEWYEKIGIEKKTGLISVEEAADVVKTMSLRAFEGDYKIMIVWKPELMNIAAANKLLKQIEEPTGKTLFIFVTEDEEAIIKTIQSRTQIVYFNKLSNAEVSNYLLDNFEILESKAKDIALQANGNINKAISIISDNQSDSEFQELFVNWVRASFRADLKMLVNWSDTMAKKGKQFQINFLKFATRVFRQALLENYDAKELSFLKFDVQGFKFENFISYIHGQNIMDMMNEMDLAIFHIERNGNPKIVLLDVSVKITRGLHTKYKV
ncbi:MAG: DNA polymerase III subunit delta' [Flavobacteriales bacterium]|nr:DNA polymerase III subunit delta' [Flavobacteriales bacterium]